jgi:membrane-associated phospholipid phosphatase
MLQRLHQFLIHVDYTSWYYLNTLWHNDFMDSFIPFLRNQWTWTPLYLFLLVFMLMNFGKRGIIWCIFFIATFAISDQLSASVVKEIFHRVRPCNNPQLSGLVHNIVPCGSGWSFPSSHAANHFSLAMFMAITLGNRAKWIWPAALCWAASVAYAQVYVGVHFPLDVVCGGFLGMVVGILTARLFHMKYNLAVEVTVTEQKA